MSRFVHFLEQMRTYASQVCMESDDRSYTYAELLDEVDRWRSRFDRLNVEPGSVIGVRADYSLSAVAALLSLFARGAITALIPRDHNADDYLVDARAAALLELNVEGNYEWNSVPSPTSHPLLDQLRARGEGGVIIFTSGTTGRPKAALQSLDRFLYKFRRAGRRFRTLAFLLFDHVAGLDTLFYTFASGGTLILARRRDPRSILELIESHQVEVLPTSPSFLRFLCVAKDEREYNLSSLKIITYGSEPMDPSTLARLNARFPNIQLSQKYGTTETGSPRSISRGNDSLWLKIMRDGVEIKVVDGLLWIRSEGAMLGYLNAPSPVDEYGWYCTGDLVELDGEWIKFRGRAADTISVGGQKVAPAEVEQVILELPFVRDALVSGEPHALLGQVVAARVALTAVAPAPREAVKRIRLHCRERLVAYKAPIEIDIVAEGFANDRQKIERKRRCPSM
jgi:long-chain acyl-CoA synthetase